LAEPFLNYQKKTGKNVNKVFLTGGGSLLLGLKQKAERIVSVPVAMADPFDKLSNPASLVRCFGEAGPSFAVSHWSGFKEITGYRIR
jgi:Tfp pilus assembly PilM family ATPase